MSWDVYILKCSHPIRSVDELSGDIMVPLGARDRVHAAVSAVFSGTDWRDSAWGTWESEHGSIEFNLGAQDLPEDMMLHVRATSAVVPLIFDLCEANEWQALDTGEGLMTREGNPERGLERWRAFRDQVIGRGPKT